MRTTPEFFQTPQRVQLVVGIPIVNHIPQSAPEKFDIPYDIDIQPLSESKFVLRIYKGDEIWAKGIYINDYDKIKPIFYRSSQIFTPFAFNALYLYAEDPNNFLQFIVLDHNPYMNKWMEVRWKKRFQIIDQYHAYTIDRLDEFWPWDNPAISQKYEESIATIAKLLLSQHVDEYEIPADYFMAYFQKSKQEMNISLLMLLLDRLNFYIKQCDETTHEPIFAIVWKTIAGDHTALVFRSFWYKPELLQHVLAKFFHTPNYQPVAFPQFEAFKCCSTKIVHAYTTVNGFSTTGKLEPLGLFEIHFTSLFAHLTYNVKIIQHVNGEEKIWCDDLYQYSDNKKTPNHFPHLDVDRYDRMNENQLNTSVQTIYLTHESRTSNNKFSRIIIGPCDDGKAYHLFPQNHYYLNELPSIGANYISVLLKYFYQQVEQKQNPAVQIHINDFLEAVKDDCPLYPYPEHYLKKQIDRLNEQARAYEIIGPKECIITYESPDEKYDMLYTTPLATIERLQECIRYFGDWDYWM